MKTSTVRFPVVLGMVLFYMAMPQVQAQTPPDGCSVLPGNFYGKTVVTQALDAFLLGACDRHDLCFRECFTPAAIGFESHYHTCNLAFLADLSAWCAFSNILQEVADAGLDPVRFQAECEAAMFVVYLVEESSPGWNAYRNDQCPYPSPYAGCSVFNDACCYFEPSPYTCSLACSQQDHLEEILECDFAGGLWDYYSCYCILPSSPIVVDLNRDGFRLTGVDNGMRFDVNMDGDAELIGWTAAASDDAFLTLDRNGNGNIDNGSELFGDRTAQPESEQPNGFLALAVLDDPAHGGNGDGLVSADDAMFGDLRLWRDVNHNGRSEEAELSSLPAAGITAIDLTFREAQRRDRYGNLFRYRSKVFFEDHTQGFAYDVFFTHK